MKKLLKKIVFKTVSVGISILILGFVMDKKAHAFTYVANNRDNSISVISPITKTVIDTIALDSRPWSVAAHPSGTYVYVTHKDFSGTVSVIDATTNLVVETITVGVRSYPVNIAIDSLKNVAYVVNRGDGIINGSVSVIELTTNKVINTVDLGCNAFDIAVHPTGAYVYVTSEEDKTISVIDTDTNTVIDTIILPNKAISVTIHPAGTHIYVTNQENAIVDGIVTIIETATNTIVDNVTVKYNPYAIAINPSGTELYVSCWGQSCVSVIETASNNVVKEIAVGNNPSGLSVNKAGDELFVSIWSENNVVVFDTHTYDLLETIDVGKEPRGLCIGGPSKAFCGITLNQQIYEQGNSITVERFLLANDTEETVAIELKAWWVAPNMPPLSIFNTGSIVLEPGLYYDFGPMLLLYQIGPEILPGNYEFNCRIIDSVTGETISYDRNLFEVR